MAGGESLFRKTALERLSSPEQLDQIMQVTSPRSWLALFALGSVIVTTLFWSVFGTIPTKVNGKGIIIRAGGVYEVVSLGAGRVTEMDVQAGDRVEKGQIVARVAQPDLLDEISKAKAELTELQVQHSLLSDYVSKEIKYESDLQQHRRARAEQTIRESEIRLKWFEERIKSEEELYKTGVIIEKQLLETKDDYSHEKDQLAAAQSELKEISVKELALRNQAEQDLSASRLKITDAERKIKILENQLELTSRVTSEASGRVLEILTDVGQLMTVGAPVLSLESSDATLQALLYVPPTEGKKIEAGMEAQISPSTVRKEEFGFIVGKVQSISSFPATTQGMMRVLGNDGLVETLSATGAPFQVYAELIPDSDTESGYRWSSGTGPQLQIFSGTLCTGNVTVAKQRPISLVIPYVKGKLGI